MAAVANGDPKRMYSWWWDSHISPKNSKWLQENLTDMDSKVKQMIKLIEEDADSFARRAEMYYKKRPELMKMVEDFYRAYRALAERYDHATGVLRQAHRTMAEAFPNQVPTLGDDSPETPPTGASVAPDELQKDALGLSSSQFHAVKRNGAFTGEPDPVISRKGLKQLNDLLGSGGVAKFAEGGRARKGLNFFDSEVKDRSTQSNGSHDYKARTLSESDRVSKAEIEIIALKKAIAKLEAEKEAGLLQYQQSLDRLTNLESEVSRAQEDSRRLNERASVAETEVQTLKEVLAKLDAEREASLVQYEQCLEKISNLENTVALAKKDAGELHERASNAETEAESLKQDLAVVEAEKEAALVEYKECLEMTLNLEDKLQHAEEDCRRMNERAVQAESEVETLKQALAKLIEEKEAAALQYQQCLELIASLELKLACAQEETQRLNCELDNGVAKLKGAEEKCLLLEKSNQSLHSELESVVQKMGTQSQELTDKQKELGKLWTSIQEERFRFMEAETAFQTLQHLHSQSQEELRSLDAELQHRAQILKDMESHSHGLQEEIQKVKEENKSLIELNVSSALSITNLEGEILSLRETIRKLEAEVELRVDQRNALQQEIYCLKEELNDLNKKHQAVLEQVDSVGLDPECLSSSVKKLQDENSELKEICETDRNEKAVLKEKLEHMEKLLAKNAILENSLAGLNVELEEVRRKVIALEESCEYLMGEKSSLVAEKAALISQLQITTENMQKLLEKKDLLENSLFDANAELEGLRMKSKSLEDSCLLLNDEKSGLMVEREHLVSQLDITQQRLENLEKSHVELNEKYLDLEKERVTILSRLEELQVSLDAEKKEHASLAQLSGTQLASMASQIHLLQEEGWRRKKEFGEQLDRALGAQIEILILQESVHDLEEKNFCLLNEYRKLLEASESSEKLISQLEHENQEQKLEVKSLLGQIQILRMGLHRVSKTLDIDVDHDCEDKNGQDVVFLNNVHGKLEETQETLSKTSDENQQLTLENSVLLVLLGQLRLEAENIVSERNILNQEFGLKSEQLLLLQSEAQKLTEMNEELRLKVKDGDQKEESLTVELESLLGKQCNLHEAYQNLQEESSKVLEEKNSLLKEVSNLKEQKYTLEEETFVLIGENISQDALCLILKNIVSEKSVELEELGKNLTGLEAVNIDLEENIRKKEGQLEAVQTENLHLKESLEKSEVELRLVRSVGDQLANEIAIGKDLLCQKESELLEAEQKLNAMLNEKTEHIAIFEDLKRKYDEVKMVQENQEKQILKLSEDHGHQSKEIELLGEANQKLEAKLCSVHVEHEETKCKERSLSDELKKERNEVELWETQAAAFFFELQTSVVHGVLFENKIHELTEACLSLKDRSNTNEMEIEELKEKVTTLEDRNGGLNDQLAAYISTIISLENCVTSLENHTILRTDLQKADNGDAKDANSLSHPDAEICPHKGEDSVSSVHEGISNLRDLERRIKAVEKAVVEMERLAVMEHLDTNTKLEAAMTQLEELKSRSFSRREKVRSRKTLHIKKDEELGDSFSSGRHLRNPVPEISESGSEVLTKDIILDQISECSSYGISRRSENVGADQMLELWERVHHDGNNAQEASSGRKSRHPSTESLVKELGVDKLEISKRFSESRQEGNMQKVLERLDSDVQKLTNLQITVQDLKSKVEITEKSKKGKGVEYDSVKEQLDESEEAILKLFDVNRKLMKNANDSSDEKPTAEPDESVTARRRRIVEQARRGSEKIGRLQLEVQKIQFLLLKFEGEKENKAKSRIADRKTRVLLRDYLYGVGKTNQNQKKSHFCACVRPSTFD